MGELAAVLTCMGLFVMLPGMSIWTSHKRKMLELQLRMRGETDSNLRGELSAMRDEIRSLRDTSMQYDISFDTALQNMDRRIGSVEQRVNQISGENSNSVNIGR